MSKWTIWMLPPRRRRSFAIVLPTSVLAAMNLQDRLGKVPSATLDIAYFEGVHEAKAWLTR